MATGEAKPETGKAGDQDEGHKRLEEIAGEFIPNGEEGAGGGDQEKPPGGAEWAMLFSVGFAIVSMRAGDHWALNDKEAMELGNAFDKVADKYKWNVKAGPEIGLAMVAVTVAAPRVVQSVQLKRQAEETAKNQGQKPGGNQGDKANAEKR